MVDLGCGDVSYSGVSLTDKIGLGVLTRLAPRELVAEVIAETGKREVRKRMLPARVVVYFVLALALFSRDSYEEVMRKLVQGLTSIGVWKADWKVPTTSALSQARVRLGVEPLRELFERVAVPCAMRSTAGAWLNGYRLMSLDGFEMEVADTEANAAHFGYSGVKGGQKGSFPKIGVLALAECGTHAIVAAEPGERSEHALARRLLGFRGAFDADMLVMCDRGLYSYALLTGVVAAGANVCFRVSAVVELPILKWLPDGSYLSYVADPDAKRNSDQWKSGQIEVTDLPGVQVRVVDYEVPGRGTSNELFTLVTNILDCQELTAVDLADAYHQRWEIELAFDEIETHQRGAQAILRSKTPDMVQQELYGMLITHYGIRQLMTEAADHTGIDPDRLSFTRSLNIIRRHTTSQAAFSPSDT
ncbi:MAG: IS4 family transposase [Mycobacterium sp.]|nr:IS4 family transposase [Mycobacterium sp.]